MNRVMALQYLCVLYVEFVPVKRVLHVAEQYTAAVLIRRGIGATGTLRNVQRTPLDLW